MDRHIKAPFDREEVKTLKAGDYVYIDGIVYSARDAAHKRMYDAIMESGCVDASGTELYEKGIVPIDLNGNVIYYLGPTPAKPGQVIGSAGPTTSSRMDKYTPLILSKGLCGMIGKGKRSQEVLQAIIDNKAVSFNVACTLIWLPLIPVMVKIVKFIIRGEDKKNSDGFVANGFLLRSIFIN